MAVTITRTAGRRADDARALRFRFRRLSLTGNFTQATGEVILAQSVSLKRILTVLHAGLAPSSDQATANEYSFIVAADGRSVTLKLYENAAAGSPSALKTDAEAYITGQFLDVVFVGE